MEKIIEFLYEDILYSIKNSDVTFKDVKGSTIFIGSGGSKVVASFVANVLEEKNKIITKVVDARDINYIDLSIYDNLFLVSTSGSNYGIKNACEKNINKYLFTTRKTKISDESLLTYEMIKRKSFIALSDTIIPMAIALKYYLGECFDETLKDIFIKLDKYINLNVNDFVNIFTGIDTLSAGVFLESTLTEAGIVPSIINYKYDYCHGRSTLNKNNNSSAILLVNKENEFDKVLTSVIKDTIKDYVVIKGISDEKIVNEFFLTLQSLYLTYNVARNLDIDLANIDYDPRAVKRLYYYKGEM